MSMITEQIDFLRMLAISHDNANDFATAGALRQAADTIEQLSAKVRSENNGGWIPITTRPMTEEEKEYYKENTDIEVDSIFNCPLPEDGQEVLITSNGYVSEDIFSEDDYYGSGFEYADIENVKAWMPKPEPYREDGDTDETDD